MNSSRLEVPMPGDDLISRLPDIPIIEPNQLKTDNRFIVPSEKHQRSVHAEVSNVPVLASVRLIRFLSCGIAGRTKCRQNANDPAREEMLCGDCGAKWNSRFSRCAICGCKKARSEAQVHAMRQQGLRSNNYKRRLENRRYIDSDIGNCSNSSSSGSSSFKFSDTDHMMKIEDRDGRKSRVKPPMSKKNSKRLAWRHQYLDDDCETLASNERVASLIFGQETLDDALSHGGQALSLIPVVSPNFNRFASGASNRMSEEPVSSIEKDRRGMRQQSKQKRDVPQAAAADGSRHHSRLGRLQSRHQPRKIAAENDPQMHLKKSMQRRLSHSHRPPSALDYVL